MENSHWKCIMKCSRFLELGNIRIQLSNTPSASHQVVSSWWSQSLRYWQIIFVFATAFVFVTVFILSLPLSLSCHCMVSPLNILELICKTVHSSLDANQPKPLILGNEFSKISIKILTFWRKYLRNEFSNISIKILKFKVFKDFH